MIDPVLLKLGPLEIRYYSLAYILGILLGIKYINFLQKKHQISVINEKSEDNLILFMILGIILGGRIGYILFYNLNFYLAQPLEIFKTWKGGLSFHGGLAGSILAMWLFAKTYRIKFFKLSDLIAAATPIGIFFGRIGNFINGELYGRVTEVKWGMQFSPYENFKRHPSQIYEALTEGLINFLILYICFNKFKLYRKTGRISALFLIIYHIMRITMENFREADEHLGLFFSKITMGQILSFPMLFLGIILWFLAERGKFDDNPKSTN